MKFRSRPRPTKNDANLAEIFFIPFFASLQSWDFGGMLFFLFEMCFEVF
jgi:hypothetical protein